MDATAPARCTRRRPARPDAGEARLLARAKRGDRMARDRLALAHLGLIRSVAAHYRNLGLSMDDLVQEGTIGLLGAIADFDPARGAAFGTYAYWRIRRSVTAALTANGRTVRLPKAMIERRHALARAREELATERRGRPTVAELAVATGLASDAVAAALDAPTATGSLDAPLPGGAPLETLVGDPAALDPEAEAIVDEQRRVLHRAVSRLPDRTRHVIERHYGLTGDPESLTSIARELGLTTQRVRSIENSGLCALARELAPMLKEGAPRA